MWHRLSHPNILPFLGVCKRIGPSPAMISPMYENGDVGKYLRNNPTADRLDIVSSNQHTLLLLLTLHRFAVQPVDSNIFTRKTLFMEI